MINAYGIEASKVSTTIKNLDLLPENNCQYILDYAIFLQNHIFCIC